jgi:hypothetical protein
VYLHIGAMKTGTTFIQKVLVDNEPQLAGAGYLFPGETWVDQVRAAQDVADAVPNDPVIREGTRGAWQSLATRMLEHDGAGSIVSMEFLSHAGPEGARAAVTSLHPADVHVVLTVRDASSTIPAQWQTAVRNGNTVPWPDFRRRVRRAGGLRARRVPGADRVAVLYRRTQDTERILGAWGPQVPASRLHVVTVPPSGGDPTLLWRRFAGVIGIDPGLGELTERANESLGYASTELMRRVNVALGPVLPSQYNPTLREHLAMRILSARSSKEGRPLLDGRTYDFALRWNQRARDAIVSTGAQLAGDLDDLPVDATARRDKLVDDQAPEPSPSELLAAAEDALAGMTKLIDRRARRASKRGIGTDDLDLRLDRGLVGAGSADPVAAAVERVTESCRVAIELRRRLRA